MKQRIICKALAVAVIILFIGMGVQPAIAEINIEPDKSELEEVKIEFFDIDRCFEHKVMLTKEQVRELKNSIDIIENQLNSTENKIEKEKIYNNVIVTFNEFGLLPDEISIDYAQKLVMGKVQNPRIVKSIEKWYNNKGSSDVDENFNCSISGYLEYSGFMGPGGRMGLNIKDKIDKFSNYYFLSILLYSLFAPLFIFLFTSGTFWWGINLLSIGYEIGIGVRCDNPDGSVSWLPSRGYVNTTGLNGTKNWEGKKLWGAIPRSKFRVFNYEHYPGVIGFTGIKLGLSYNNFIGNALWVKIKVGNKP